MGQPNPKQADKGERSAGEKDAQSKKSSGSESEPMEVDEFVDYETVFDDFPCKVQDGLFIGSAMAESNRTKLKQKGITHILSVADGYMSSHPNDFVYKQINVQDECSEDIMAHCAGPQGAFAFIDSAMASGGACFVHCMAGVSRSSTVVIGWLMQRHRLDPEQAFRRVHAVRPWICPNPGFRSQLQRFHALEYDLGKWKAWRHVMQETPGASVNLAGVIGRQS